MRIKTVDVDRNGVKVRINESDFNPARDKMWGDAPAPESKEPEGDEKDAIIAKLAENGITRDRRTSLANLQSLLDEVEE